MPRPTPDQFRAARAAARGAWWRAARRPVLLIIMIALAMAGIAAGGAAAAADAGATVPGSLSASLAVPAAGALTPGLPVLSDMDRAVDGPGSARPAIPGDRTAGNLAVGADPSPGRSPRAPATPASPGRARPAPETSDQHGRPGTADRGRRQPARHGHPAAPALRTSCRTVAHIGDSTSVDLISPASLPDPAQRLPAAYARVGVQHLRISASGGRSIVEEMPGQANGDVVARAWHDGGYRGCWVFALGTNDAADISAGSQIGMAARIDRMMADAHGQPVMWVNTRTELSAGPWAEANEQAWDNALHQALARYPNLRIFNWASVVQPGWFLPDGIHYNSVGCADRARAIADALARAFPLHGHSSGRVVG